MTSIKEDNVEFLHIVEAATITITLEEATTELIRAMEKAAIAMEKAAIAVGNANVMLALPEKRSEIERVILKIEKDKEDV